MGKIYCSESPSTIITNFENLERFLNLYDSKYNGLTLCTGSLGCTKTNDIYVVGDTRVKTLRQLATATADGAIAATEIIKKMEE